MSPTILVTGAGGQLGRLVVEQLLALKAGPVIAGSRDPGKLGALARQGASTRKIDFDDAASLAAGFVGVDRVLIISTDALDKPGRRLAQHRAAVAAAKAAGVKHLVYTSMPNPDPGSPIGFAPDHLGTEAAIKDSGLPHTILRNSWYFENLKHTLPNVLASGAWPSAAGAGKLANIARADAALAATRVLVAETPPTGTFTLTGPEALTIDAMAATVATVFGKPIKVVHLNDAQLQAGLEQHGLAPGHAAFVVSFDTNTRMGRVGAATDDFQRLTGRAPTALRDHLATHRAAYA